MCGHAKTMMEMFRVIVWLKVDSVLYRIWIIRAYDFGVAGSGRCGVGRGSAWYSNETLPTVATGKRNIH